MPGVQGADAEQRQRQRQRPAQRGREARLHGGPPLRLRRVPARGALTRSNWQLRPIANAVEERGAHRVRVDRISGVGRLVDLVLIWR